MEIATLKPILIPKKKVIYIPLGLSVLIFIINYIRLILYDVGFFPWSVQSKFQLNTYYFSSVHLTPLFTQS
jgi:hypothetical protein